MHIQFKNSHGGLSPKLEDRIEKKLQKLARMTDTPEHEAQAIVSLERSVGSHQNGDVWEAAITIDANGDRFHTSELSASPDSALEKVLKEIRTELKKTRGKRQSLIKREGGFWKRFQDSFARSA